MTRAEAIREETRRYVNACANASTVTHGPHQAAHARYMAHIHALALGRLRGQTVAPWIHEADCHQYVPVGAR